jgi:sugar phosphate permease
VQIGIVIYGIGFMLFSQIEGVLAFYLTFTLIAIGSSLGGFATVMVAVVSWFSAHRSKALAVAQMGFSIGGLSVPLVVLALESFGWRSTAFVSGLIIFAVGLPLTRLIHHRPEDRGEVVDGIHHPTHTSAQSGHSRRTVKRDLSAREALRTRAFWLIALGHGLALLTVASLMVHLISHLTTGPMAFTLAAAGGVVALMTAAQIVGQVTSGFIGDRFNKRVMCAGCMLAHGTGLTLIAVASAPWMVMIAVVIHGIGWGLRGPLMTAMRADYFGVSSFGTIMGFSTFLVMLGMSLGPIFAGYMADVTGDYQFGFLILAAGSALGSVAFLAATPPRAHTSADPRHQQ